MLCKNNNIPRALQLQTHIIIKPISSQNICTNLRSHAGFFPQSSMYLLGTGRWAPLVLLPQGPPGVPWGEGCRMCILWCKHEAIHLQLLLQRGRIERVHLVTSGNILQREHSTVETTHVGESRHFCFYHVSELISCVTIEQRDPETYMLQRLLCMVIHLSLLHWSITKQMIDWGALVHGHERPKHHQLSLTSCHHHPLYPHLSSQPEAASPNPVWKPSYNWSTTFFQFQRLWLHDNTNTHTFGFFSSFACLMKLRVNISNMQGWVSMSFTGSLNEYCAKIKMLPSWKHSHLEFQAQMTKRC